MMQMKTVHLFHFFLLKWYMKFVTCIYTNIFINAEMWDLIKLFLDLWI